MGKKWHYQKKRPRNADDNNNGGGGGGESANGEQLPKKPRRAAVIGLANVKGHQAVVGTCDIRNDRQATAELVDLLNSVADDMYPQAEEDDEEGNEGGTAATGASQSVTTTTVDTESKAGGGGGGGDGAVNDASASSATPEPEKSVEEMIREEADELRAGKAKTHRFKSVNTSVKGVVMVCVMDPKVDILRLVDALYAEIRTTKMRHSRFLERVTPLQVTAYSELEAFKEAAEPIISAALPPVAEGVPLLPVVAKPVAAAAPANTNDQKVETGATASKETPATGAPAGAAASAETTSAPIAATSCAGDEAGASRGKQSAVAAAATASTPENPGDGNLSGAKTDGIVTVDSGNEKSATSDKRWKFRVDIRRRNSGLKRLDLIHAVAGSVGEGHSVSMSSPEVIFNMITV